MEELQALRPPLLMAIAEDARVFCYHRGQRFPSESRWKKWLTVLRLTWKADDFLGVLIYRVRTSLRAAGVPILPRLLDFIDIIFFSIRIGDKVVIREGVYVPHGEICLGGITLIGRRCYLAPWIGIGLVRGNLRGPRLGDGVFVGTGAKILGDLQVGNNAIIGTNAAVLRDVPANATVGGVPARILEEGATDEA